MTQFVVREVEYGGDVDGTGPERWAGMAGFKDWAKGHYNATLRAGLYDDWTSITFKTEQDLNRFKQDFGVEE